MPYSDFFPAPGNCLIKNNSWHFQYIIAEPMYLEHFHLNKSPFDEKADTKIFFKHAGRGELLRKLSEALRGGKPLIKIIGNEGSGKTMLCRLLLQQLSGKNFDSVYLDNPVGSFDDLLHVVCLDLGMDPTLTTERDMLSELHDLLALRKKEQKKVVLIVDEAEKLFLATLERFMRAICETGDDYGLYVVLVGRPTLDANLGQLTVYCSNVDIKEGYVLEPLTAEETADYLDFRLRAAGLSENGPEKIFTEGAVQKIFESAGGNLRLINILAEEALQASSSDKSFLVLLDHVAGQEDQHKTKIGALVVPTSLQSKKMLFAGAAILIILLLVFLFRGQGNKEPDKQLAKPDKQLGHLVQSDHPPPPEQLPPPTAAADTEAVTVQQSTVSETKAISSTKKQPPPEVDTLKPAIVELKPEGVKSIPKADEKAQEKVKEAVAVTGKVRKNPSRSGEELYQERIRASAKWLAGAYHNSYTVQLMMLASEQATPNIKKMLTEDEYSAIKDKLYILRKKTSPPTLFVFYGTYDSMEQARQARNNMPLFLRKHHPYALSISDALKKTED
ncbi:MAG: hypothetical protein DSY80_08270 [Desulfocapsa sp.]|nr:MAG: hypothetical protein DSY80_08270 [Desulfocapsa sp.]